MALMHWGGMEIYTRGSLCNSRQIHIDRVKVRVCRTLFGEILYFVEGTLGERGIWEQISPEYKNAVNALNHAAEIEEKIKAARRADEVRHEEIMKRYRA